MLIMKEIEFINTKEQFIQAEYSLLREWSPYLEKRLKGLTLLYLQIQTGVNREKGNNDYMKSFLSISTLMERCNLSRPTVVKMISILEELGFIIKESGKGKGKNNRYIIQNLPEYNPFLMDKILGNEKKNQNVKVDHEIFSWGISDRQKFKIEKAKRAISKLEGMKRKWNCNDIIKFYKESFCIAFNGLRTTEIFTNRHKANMKMMLGEYGQERVKKAIKFCLDNWIKIPYINDEVTLLKIFGYRESLVPESEAGKLTKIS